jgi:DNA-binding CsgD family transcriptional regulator
MIHRSTLSMLGYGAVAAAALACLWLISLAPMRLNWGRELIGAAIAIVAMVVGVRLSQRRHPGAGMSPPAPHAPDRLAVALQSDSPAAAEPTAAPPCPDLSARERQVLQLLARGLSNKQLARELSLSENTIKTHLANLYAKLQVSRRTEALAAARRIGLFDAG